MSLPLRAQRFHADGERPSTAKEAPSQATFRAALGRMPSGVSLITTGRGEERAGLTATSASSLSLEPATMMVGVNRSDSSYPILARCGVFGVNVLGADHAEWARRFAGGAKQENGSSRVFTLNSGVWLLSDALAAFDCEVEEIIERHTHAIVIGRVTGLAVSEAPSALIYWRGAFDQMGWSAEEVSRAVGLTPPATRNRAL